MREKQGFRDTMAALNEMFPEQGALNKTEVAKFLGVSPRTVYRYKIPVSEVTGRITKADLARLVCM